MTSPERNIFKEKVKEGKVARKGLLQINHQALAADVLTQEGEEVDQIVAADKLQATASADHFSHDFSVKT